MSVRRSRVLVVEDDPSARLALCDHLDSAGWDVAEADSLQGATTRFEEGEIDAVITDFALPDGDSLALLERFKTPGLPIIVLTAYGTIDLAVRAMKQGADHFLTKPVELPVVESLLRESLAQARHGRRGAEAEPSAPFIGASEAIRQLEGEARGLLASDSPVLIFGETGSGKGVLARWLHENGPRRAEPYVDLDCAGLKHEFLEAELFGHEKGAFAGATASKLGLFEFAHGGTLFLDSIGDTSLDVQAKLLKAIEEKSFRRMGGLHPRHVDVRIIAAAHHDLPERVRKGGFRDDLWFRISALLLHMPALRERRDDIPVLAQHLLSRIRPGLALNEAAEAALVARDWPGNLRELRNVLERAALRASDDVIGPELLLFDSLEPGDREELSLSLRELERRHVERVLRAEGGSVERAALRLGIARSTLYEMLRRTGRR